VMMIPVQAHHGGLALAFQLALAEAVLTAVVGLDAQAAVGPEPLPELRFRFRSFAFTLMTFSNLCPTSSLWIRLQFHSGRITHGSN
jgi:hypothetical protein